MDPQLKSLLTTAATFVAGTIASWLITKGVITGDQGPMVINLLIGAALAGGAALIAWWKSRSHTPAALAAAAAGPPTAPTPGVTVTVDPTKATPALVAAANAPTNAVKLAA